MMRSLPLRPQQVTAATQVPPPRRPVRRETSGSSTGPKPGSPTAGTRRPPSCSPPRTSRSNTKYDAAAFCRIRVCFLFFCPTLLSRCCFSLSAGDQCVPGPNAAPGPLSGQEGRQAGHQSVVHRQHHPGGLQDTAGKHAGASRGRLQDRHGNFAHRMPHYRVLIMPYV